MGKDHLQSVTAAANATATICWFWHKDDCLLSFSGNDTDTGMLLVSVDASGGIEIGRVSYFQHGRLYILNLSPESREAKATERRIDRAERSLTSRHLMQQSVLCFSLQVALKIHHRDAQQHIREAFPHQDQYASRILHFDTLSSSTSPASRNTSSSLRQTAPSGIRYTRVRYNTGSTSPRSSSNWR
ncbi:hypothetical protein Forpi1262_v012950 [Fusarium oxysporum f. sp. raphani]|uniref:Uncharacterized protein n=1 Tax=Fusarium oxysporum f. sp. raphani TaxID=96318 RepID=A0A8J5PDU7_FUSOX|nr:hypothetical protein Forpi1262_v012950 [Fusarium oxysporum f. sp. raphani]